MVKDTTFVSGFWPVSENTKRSKSKYFQFIRRTCHLISGGNLILYYDGDEVLEVYRRSAKRYGVTLLPRRLPIADLPGARYAQPLLDGCKAMDLSLFDDLPDRRREKGMRHNREYRQSGEEAYLKVVNIWISKVLLLTDLVIPENPFSSNRFTWADASLSRFNWKRQNWDIRRHAYDDAVLSHYGNLMRYHGTQLPLNASYLSATPDVWAQVSGLYAQQLDRALTEPYAHDEETVLGMCHSQNPALFHKLGDMDGKLGRKLADVRAMIPYP